MVVCTTKHINMFMKVIFLMYVQPVRNLKWMDLSSSVNLKVLPDLSTTTNLKELDCSFCSSLVELPLSIGNAINLEILNLYDCSNLVELPSSIGNFVNIKKFNFRGCSSLVELPSSIGNATKLEELELGYCSRLVELPSSIVNATNLKELYLYNCSSLVKLPFSIGSFSNLKKFKISGCSNLIKLSSSIGNAIDLKELDFSFCSSLVELPSSIGNATNLELLDLRGCSNLVELPSSIGNAIINLDRLDFSGCSSLVEIPSSIGNAINLKYLEFSGCSSLVELPTSIGNFHKLSSLTLKGCSKLEVLPININLQSLEALILTDCSLLKSFPEISTNISYLDLSGTAIEEVPSSISLWSRLETLHMSYSENLKEFPHALDNITDLHWSDTKIQEVAPWVKKVSRLRRLVMKGCNELLSLPQLPDSLSELDAENCESLERLDCFFLDPRIILNFANCFKLNKEARDVIIRTSTCEVTVLPGREMTTYFNYRANGDSLRVKLNERPFPSSVIFKACILLVNNNDGEAGDEDMVFLDCCVLDKQNGVDVPCSLSNHVLPPPLTEHLYIFEFEAEVTSNDLFFEFSISSVEWVIKECGVHNVNTKKRMRITRTLSTFRFMDTKRTSEVVVKGSCEVEEEEEEINGDESAEIKKGQKRMKFNDEI